MRLITSLAVIKNFGAVPFECHRTSCGRRAAASRGDADRGRRSG
jgi:hypothetical protein